MNARFWRRLFRAVGAAPAANRQRSHVQIAAKAAPTRKLGILGLLAAVVAPVAHTAEDADPTADVLVIVGAPGEPEYAAGFTAAAEAWRNACEAGGATYHVIGIADVEEETGSTSEEVADRERVQTRIAELAQTQGERPLWIAYLGHGTFDGRETRLNLRGPDITATEFAAWLAPMQRPLVVVLGNSASGPFLPLLSAKNRVIITATETGDEVNYARFGERFAESVGDPAADLDQDGQTTVLEAYLMAARRVQDFYNEELRLATEHALLDDNADARGTPPDWFRGTRATKTAEGGASVDGTFAHRIALVQSAAERALTDEQRARRNQLEEELEQLRQRKDSLSERDYLRELETRLRAIGEIYGSVPQPDPDPAVEAEDPAAEQESSEQVPTPPHSETPQALRPPDS